MSVPPSASARLENSEAVPSRTDLRDLGYERRAVDVIFRLRPVIVLPGYSRPLIRVADFQGLIARPTYRNDGIRP